MKKMLFEVELDVPAGMNRAQVTRLLEDVLDVPTVPEAHRGLLRTDDGLALLRGRVGPRRPDNFEDVCAFNARFDLPTPDRPGMLTDDVHEYRLAFLHEELIEYMDATTLDGKIDALVDLVYVALGTARLHGFLWEPHWEEVQRANMEKERVASADESKRGHAFDVRKPEGWVGPDHVRVFRESY